jgi:rod shape-determining protein MreC
MITLRPEPQAKVIRFLSMTIFYPAYATVSQVTNFTNVYSENKRMRQELAEASTHLQMARELETENARLLGLLGSAEHHPYELVPVRVVARDPSSQYRGVVVSGGKEQGVTDQMPLVAEHGAVGRVIQVMGNMSMVQLLRDPSSRASVMVSRSRSVGILGTENGRDFFVRLRSHEDALAGDTVVTSGLGGIFPKGLTVGVVSSIDDKTNPLFKRAYIDFAVDFDRIEELFIMRLPPQWAARLVELDSMKIEK